MKIFRPCLSLTTLLLSASLLTGCIRETRGEPLYAGAPQPPERVARLVGPIQRVDGKAVPGSIGTFELLPGCHVVQIGGTMGSFKADPAGGWVTQLPRLIYAFPMRAGYSYSITFQPEASLGTRAVGYGSVVAQEKDRSGHHRVVAPAHSSADVAECVRTASGS